MREARERAAGGGQLNLKNASLGTAASYFYCRCKHYIMTFLARRCYFIQSSSLSSSKSNRLVAATFFFLPAVALGFAPKRRSESS